MSDINFYECLKYREFKTLEFKRLNTAIFLVGIKNHDNLKGGKTAQRYIYR